MTTDAAANAWEEQLIADVRANGGRPSSGPLEGHPLLLLYTVGAKSGERRRAILTYSRDGNDAIVAGTAGGSKTDPAWLSNIKANPEVEVELGNEVFKGTAEIAEGAERERLWNAFVEMYPPGREYPGFTDRELPVVVLERAA
jgi:deazaflavin-dependent oxidoreductase (nitroreductase family)